MLENLFLLLSQNITFLSLNFVVDIFLTLVEPLKKPVVEDGKISTHYQLMTFIISALSQLFL